MNKKTTSQFLAVRKDKQLNNFPLIITSPQDGISLDSAGSQDAVDSGEGAGHEAPESGHIYALTSPLLEEISKLSIADETPSFKELLAVKSAIIV